MTVALRPASPLRLPSVVSEAAESVSGMELRERLEQLMQRRFGGRVELRMEAQQADLLMVDGELKAAAVRKAGRQEAVKGQDALTFLMSLSEAEWSWRAEAIEARALSCLAGLGGPPEICRLRTGDELRALLRDLVHHDQVGVLELSSGDCWGRTLVGDGVVYGSYSSSEPALVASLAPLGELLVGQPPEVCWYPASAAVVLEIPRPVKVELSDGVAELERLIFWSVSRFEGSWGRAREHGPSAEALRETLGAMLDALQRLVQALDEARGHPVALVNRLAELDLEGAAVRGLSQLDPRLIGMPAREACGLLLQLVVAALQRVMQACPEPTVAECCRQAAALLASELQASSGVAITSAVGARS